MNNSELHDLIQHCIAGDISSEDHQRLQEQLKSDFQARAIFRELMDIEAALRTWSSDGGTVAEVEQPHRPQRTVAERAVWRTRRLWLISAAVALTIAMLSGAWWLWQPTSDLQRQFAEDPAAQKEERTASVGTFGRQHETVWKSPNSVLTGGRVSLGTHRLTAGAAELKFDSGTNVILQAPCELEVVGTDVARLLTGSVVVHVTELSDGFTLNTPDATILDEGTEYAVSLDDDATEVHVFDGQVVWKPVTKDQVSPEERIETGEARRYLRAKPFGGARIPLNKRLFVRQIEADVRESAGEELLAYDGFENLAGRIARGRSGFGWQGGWRTGRGRRGRLGEIIDAPDDTVFGFERTGRRLIRLTDGDGIWRDFEEPLPLESGSVYYASFLLKRVSPVKATAGDVGQFFQLSLYNSGQRRGHRSRKWFTFGISSEGLPFVKTISTITSTAATIENGAVHYCVAKILVIEDGHVETLLRVYQPRELIDRDEPTAWTTRGSTGPCDFQLAGVRLSVGTDAEYEVDELKVGTSWQSVTSAATVPK